MSSGCVCCEWLARLQEEEEEDPLFSTHFMTLERICFVFDSLLPFSLGRKMAGIQSRTARGCFDGFHKPLEPDI